MNRKIKKNVKYIVPNIAWFTTCFYFSPTPALLRIKYNNVTLSNL